MTEIKKESAIAEFGAELVNGIGKMPHERIREEITAEIEALKGGAPIKQAVFWETMTQASDPHSGARIRVWRKSETMPEYNDIELQLLINKIPGQASMKDVFDILSTVEGVTAIELTDANGMGGVKYLEW